MKVVYVPGMLGSTLSWDPGGGAPLQPIWADAGAILGGGLADLDLAADGVSPGPLAQGRVIVPTGLFAAVYGPLASFLRLIGHDVYILAPDWRLSLIPTAAAAWPLIQAWASGQPIAYVAHSRGGLLARAIYAQMLAGGADAQCATMVTLAAPHYGSLEIPRLWWRLPALYQGLQAIAGWAGWIVGTPGPAYLDQVVASHPAWYELIAWAGEGPLFAAAPDQAAAIQTPAFYAGANPWVSAGLLQSAEVVQTLLSAAIPSGRLSSIFGVGYETAYQLAPSAPPSSVDGYLYTLAGDGLVTAAQASPTGAAAYAVYSQHAEMPLRPDVWAMIAAILSGSVPSTAAVPAHVRPLDSPGRRV